MIDEQSELILKDLYPPFAEKLRQLIAVLGEGWRVIEGYRSFAEQNAFFEQGRSRPGAVITRDRAGYSGHNYGVVAHLVPITDGKVDWDNNEAFLQLMIEAGKLGLSSGGNWGEKFLEKSRVEMVVLTMDECLALFKTGQVPAVWAAFDANLGVQPVAEPAAPAAEDTALADGAAEEVVGEEVAGEAEPDAPAEPEPDSPVVARRKKAAKKKTAKK